GWQDGENRLRLHNLHGGFVAQRDSVDAVLEGGNVHVGGSSSILLMTFPPGFPVTYRNGTIAMGAGVTFTMAMGDVTVRGKLRSLETQTKTPLIVDLDTEFSAVGSDLATSGRTIVHAELGSGGQLLSGKGTLMFDDIELAATFSHDFAAGRGTLSSNQEITVTTPLLAGIFETWALPYDVTAGKVTAGMDLAWFQDEPIQGKASFVMAELAGNYEEYIFNGVSGSLLVQLMDDGVELTPATISVDRVDIGLKLTDITLDAAWRDETLTVKGMKMQVLGGSASFSPIDIDIDETAFEFEVELTGLSLAEVLALEGDDIKGNGVLNGRLPIQINKGLVSMTNGQLAAENPGGTIRLSTGFGASTGQLGLDFAIRALTNFNYSNLDVNADYAENGDLTLVVHLRGTNPEVEKGRPIVYNLTINENVPVLLESLRAQRAIIDRIENKVLNRKG
ncbi:MAG: YdbH domain-containing protein, partial [Gammaproteobacteria bacterium]|nr:YdbH domain-containing protein [Gammaproteobacteria bacterium]